MPTKSTYFPRVRFNPVTLEKAISAMREYAEPLWRERAASLSSDADGNFFDEHGFAIHGAKKGGAVPERLIYVNGMSTVRGLTQWTFDTKDEFYADIRTGAFDSGSIKFGTDGSYLPGVQYVHVDMDWGGSRVSVGLPTRAFVERIMDVFEDAVDDSRMPEPVSEPPVKPTVFIGHGGASQEWRDLKDHLKDLHNFEVVTFESGERAGHVVRDILEEMLVGASFAILVLSAEDQQPDGTMRARQNVIHEAGLFQGRLGFGRAIILLENGVQSLSNLDGIQYIAYDRGNIASTYGHVIAALNREFTPPSLNGGR